MEVLVLGVSLWDGVVAVDDAQLGRILERVSVVAEQVEHAAQRPDVGLRVDPVVVPRVQHLGRPVHGRRVLGHLPAARSQPQPSADSGPHSLCEYWWTVVARYGQG